MKLPKLTMRTFDGDLTSWVTFWDSFDHENRDLSDVDKFNYLRSLLEKGAYDVISGLTLSADNYIEAITLLKKRYMVIKTTDHFEAYGCSTESGDSDVRSHFETPL